MALYGNAPGPQGPPITDWSKLPQNGAAPTAPAPDPYGAASSFEQVYNGPTNVAYDAKGANYAAQIAASGQLASGDEASLRRNYDIAMRQLALQREGLGIDTGAANRQLGYYDQLGNWQNRGTENSVGLLNRQHGYASENYNNQLSQFGVQDAGVTAQSAHDLELNKSAAIAAGAATSSGLRSDQQFISGEAARAHRTIDLQKANANIDYRQRLTELDSQTRGLLIDAEITKLSNTEQKARLTDRLKQLDITARQYNLSAEQLASNLQAGLDAAGAGDSIRVGQLMDAMLSNDINRASSAVQAAEQLMAIQGYYAQTQAGSG